MIQIFRTVLFWLLGLDQPGTIIEATEWDWYTALQMSTGLIAVLAIVGVAAAAINFLPRNGIPWKARVVVSFIRLVGFAVLIIMLCQLELRLNVRRALRPNVAVVTDTSGSMGLRDKENGPTRLEAAKAFRAGPLARLESTVNVAPYELNWQLQPGDGSEAAGMSHHFDGLAELARHERDLQAVIILTDGNDTTGNTGAAVAPIFAARGVPVYPVVFGRSEGIGRGSIRFTGAGDYARLGDDYHLEAELAAIGLGDQIARVRLYLEGFETPIAEQEGIRLGEEPVRIRFILTQKQLPEKPGRYTFRIVADGITGSATQKLLETEHTVELVDQHIRVLYLDVPRDERKILGHWLKYDQVIDLATLVYLPKEGWYATGEMHHENVGTGLPEQESDLYEYDVIILGDIPRGYFKGSDPSETKMGWLMEFVKRRGGGLVTLGGNDVYSAGQYERSPLGSILPFTIERMRDPQIPKKFKVIPTSIGYSHPIMQLEWDFEGNRDAWLDLPELEGCNRVNRLGKEKPGALLLAVREFPKEKKEPVPIIAYQSVGKGKVLSLTVDTTWRWEMQRPRGDEQEGEPEGTDYFRRFWGNAIRYLAPDPRLNPERPQIDRREPDAAVGQTITLTTRLVDRIFKPMRHADLTVRVTAPSGKVVRMYPDDSESKQGVYEYDITLTEPGDWRVEAVHKEAEVMVAIKKAERNLAAAKKKKKDKALIAEMTRALEVVKSVIAVEEIRAGESRAELEDPRARPAIMRNFAVATGGRAFGPGEGEELLKTLDLATHLVSRSYTVAVWNLPALMVLFIGLVGLDCLIRKRRGQV